MYKKILSYKYWNAIFLLANISIKKRHGNSFLGNIWSFVQPFINIMVISYFMGFILRTDMHIIIKNMVGALPFWNFIMHSTIISSNSLINKAEILKRIVISKTYFPISDTISNIQTMFFSFAAMYFSLMLI